MTVLPERPSDQPIRTKWINRLLIVLLIIAAIAAGYYANLAQSRLRVIRQLRDQVERLNTQVVLNRE